MGERVGVCLVGFGYAGLTFQAPLIVASNNLSLVCVVTRKSEEEVFKALGVAVRCFATLEEASKGAAFEVVVVATPNKTHAPLASAALALGKHVVVDKPFTCSVAEAEELLAQPSDRVLMCFQNRRWDSDFLTVQREVPLLGDVVLYRSEWKRYRPAVKENWRWVAGEPAAGLLWDLGPHMLDQTIALFGMPSSVYCQTAVQRAGALVDDYFHITLRYAARPRLVCQLESGCLFHADNFDDRSFFVYGDNGSFEKRRGTDPQEAVLRAGGKPRCEGWGAEKQENGGVRHLVGGVPERVLGERSDYTVFFESVGRAVRGTGPAPVTAQEARDVIRLVEAAVASSVSGKRIDL